MINTINAQKMFPCSNQTIIEQVSSNLNCVCIPYETSSSHSFLSVFESQVSSSLKKLYQRRAWRNVHGLQQLVSAAENFYKWCRTNCKSCYTKQATKNAMLICFCQKLYEMLTAAVAFLIPASGFPLFYHRHYSTDK